MKKISIISIFIFLIGLAFVTTSCEDMMPDDSSRVVYEEDNQLKEPNDSLYSLWGILQKVQMLADRYVLLGEVRADLVDLSSVYATNDIRALANYDYSSLSDTCVYTRIRDYYAIINNCNYFLAHVDTSYITYNPVEAKPLLREYAAVKGIRAWSYMQLALTYGKIPFYLHPLTTLDDVNKVYKDESIRLTLEEIAPKLIEDLEKVAEVDLPSWTISWKEDEGKDNSPTTEYNVRNMLFPIRFLMGELYLLQNKYQEAATQYYRLIEKEEFELEGGERCYLAWNKDGESYSIMNYKNMFKNASTPFLKEMVTGIPTMNKEEHGFISELEYIFGNGSLRYQELMPSSYWKSLCEQQLNGSWSSTSKMPVYNTFGDARVNMYRTYYLRDNQAGIVGIETYNENYKYYGYGSNASTANISIYRVAHVYLRFAEAINRMGYPEIAFAILKYGLNETTMTAGLGYVSEEELESFPFKTYFLDGGIKNDGIHSRGCFSSDLQYITAYKIPESETKADSIFLVEQILLNEMALETCFEGTRLADLIRIAKRCEIEDGLNSKSFLAYMIARRSDPFMSDEEIMATDIYKKIVNSSGNSFAEGNYLYLPIK